METVVNQSGNSEVLAIHTEDIDLYRRLRRWESCLSCKSSLRCTLFGKDEMYVMAFDLRFPKKMKGHLERACEISNKTESGKDRKIIWERTDFDPPAWVNLYRQIIELFLMDGGSKTAQEVLQRLDRSIGKERIQWALRDLSRPYAYWPLERHSRTNGCPKYSLTTCYQERSRSVTAVRMV